MVASGVSRDLFIGTFKSVGRNQFLTETNGNEVACTFTSGTEQDGMPVGGVPEMGPKELAVLKLCAGRVSGRLDRLTVILCQKRDQAGPGLPEGLFISGFRYGLAAQGDFLQVIFPGPVKKELIGLLGYGGLIDAVQAGAADQPVIEGFADDKAFAKFFFHNTAGISVGERVEAGAPESAMFPRLDLCALLADPVPVTGMEVLQGYGDSPVVCSFQNDIFST